jgi:hypothetical protein
MEYLIGAGMALAVAVGASRTGFDRDRSFYPTNLVVIASTYDLFAAIGGSPEAFAIDSLIQAAFIGLSVIGFRTNLWLVVAGLFGHGMLDLVHGHLINNPGVPAWWPAFCMSYDVAAAAYLALLLLRSGNERLSAAHPAIAAPFAEAR